ncbi:hypothetical protein AKO1_015341 [Acrasis kona]|uniref:RCC1-like domain-containing protein n=1 Tax=Acrasis kona TaxID=1008807 RepID=A0AAW2ZFQ8_9EUKA
MMGGEYQQETFRVIQAMSTENVSKITTGDQQYYALMDNGNVYAFGHNEYGQCGTEENSFIQVPTKIKTLKNITHITSGGWFLCAIDDEGRLFCCGINSHNQLCTEKISISHIPIQLNKDMNVSFAQVSSGFCHTFAITNDRQVYSWGDNTYKQLGLGHSNEVSRLQHVELLKNERILQMAGGGRHSLALTYDGRVFSFGDNAGGQCASKGKEAVQIPTLISSLSNHTIIQISAGWNHSLFLTDKGTVYSCGTNDWGQLGREVQNGCKMDYQPARVMGELYYINVASIATGPCSMHSFAISNTGCVYAFGCNDKGQCGFDDREERKVPTLVEKLSGYKVETAVSANRRSLVLSSTDTAYEQKVRRILFQSKQFYDIVFNFHEISRS